MSLLEFENIVDPQITFSKKYPLSNIVRKGESLVIKGSNGSGKTTLIKILAGLKESPQGLVETVSLFYCGHQTGLKLSWTVQQNLLFRLSLYGNFKNSLDEIISCLKSFKLLQILPQKVETLSKGQQQQLALISGLLSPYKLWILDEPFAHLDYEALQQWKQIIQDFCDKGGGVVYSTHQPSAVPASSNFLELN